MMGKSGKKPLSRTETFFGLHFDLHPGKNDTQLGEHITEDMIAGLMEKVQPDFVQYDSVISGKDFASWIQVQEKGCLWYANGRS